MRDVRKAYSEAKTVLLTVLPFAASLLNKARVVVTKAVPTAAVDKDNKILINPDFFMSLSPEERVFILAHEALHWAFLDVQRVGKRNHLAWNIVTDGINNNALLDALNPGKLSAGMVTLNTLSGLTGINVSELKEMSKEKIYDALVENITGGGGGPGGFSNIKLNDPIGRDLYDDVIEDGDILQDGSPDIYEGSVKDIEDTMKRAIAEAEQMQKLRGTMPAGLARMVDNILRPKLPWKVLLKQILRDGLGKTGARSWKKPSRRNENYPGVRSLTTPTVWVGIDTSGSISQPELEQFLGEIYGIVRQFRARMVVIPWDATIYEPVKITSLSRIKMVTEHLRGGGGTDPSDFLKYVLDNMRSLDAVVILSDGYIGRSEDYLSLAKPLAAKASTCVFVSTGAKVEWPNWKFMKL